jgi:hypothetical protein
VVRRVENLEAVSASEARVQKYIAQISRGNTAKTWFVFYSVE